MFAVLDVLLMFTDHSYLNSVYVISYNYSWQCVWAHIHGLYAYYHLEPRYQSERQKARALTGSIFGIYNRFRSGLNRKQEPVDRLDQLL